MTFHRTGEVISAFCSCPSFNFDGSRAVRRQLRRLRKEGIGATLYVGIAFSSQAPHFTKSGYRVKTSKYPFVSFPSGNARKTWVCNSSAIIALMRKMPFRCPRCYSDKRPRQWSRHDTDMHFHRWRADELKWTILCDECEKMNEIRETRRAERAVQEITALQRDLNHLQRQIK